MVDTSAIRLEPGQHAQYYVPGVSKEQTLLASDLLTENHQQHHIFFNNDGFHNHIAHHLLTMWALKAQPSEIANHYENNKTYQRPSPPVKPEHVKNMDDPSKFKSFLGKERFYAEFLRFFQEKIEESSWQDVILKYVFAKDDRADDMLVRLFAGFLHPIIHLGLGIEFSQPAIIAEALAQAAVHDNWIGRLLVPAEQASSKRDTSKSIAALLEEIQQDETLKRAPRLSDGNKLRDGVIGRAGDRMIDYAAQISVSSSDLDRATAEMINAAAWYTGGAQRDDKQVKFDFYYMHCVNSSIFFSSFSKQKWLPNEDKARLLEWKARVDIAMYVSRGTPTIRTDLIRKYKPKHPSGWDGIIKRVCKFEDDGHASKLVRALANGQIVSEPYDGEGDFKLKRDDWLQLGHMAIDSVEAGEPRWVRNTGFDEAWKGVGPRL